MDATISMIRAGVGDLATAMEFFHEAFPDVATVESDGTEAMVLLGETALWLHSDPDAGPSFGVRFTVTVPDLVCVTSAGRKFAAKKFKDRIRADGMREVTYVVTQGLAITFKCPRRRRPTINKRSSQAATKKTGKRRLPRVSSV